MSKDKIKEIAKLREDFQDAILDEVNAEEAMKGTDEYKFYMLKQDESQVALVKTSMAENEYKKDCANAYGKTEEKVYLGGKIRLMKTFKYDEADAINWAIEHKTQSVLKISKGDFKNIVCRTPLCPDFVEETITAKLYIDGDLSQFVEGDNVNSKE